jgi:hypothetical protein
MEAKSLKSQVSKTWLGVTNTDAIFVIVVIGKQTEGMQER